MRWSLLLRASLFLGCFAIPFAGRAQVVPPVPKKEHARPAVVSVLNTVSSTTTKFEAFPKEHTTGGYLAGGDLDGDGQPEIVVGSGMGSAPEVRVFSSSGVLKHAFLAYGKDFKGGVRVAVGDLDGDGRKEIVTAPGPGSEPLIRRFAMDGTFPPDNGFLAYTPNMKAGVYLAVHDLDGGGKAEIITAPGPGGGPHVRVFRGDFSATGADVFAFGSDMTEGVSVTVLRTGFGPRIAVAPLGWVAPTVKLYAFAGSQLNYDREFSIFDASWKSGATLAAFDADGDGADELAAFGNGGATSSELRIYSRAGGLIGNWFAMDKDYRGGLSATAVDTNGDGRAELASMPVAPVLSGPLDKDKFIHVNIGQQRIYAYERGRLVKTFLVSTGTYKYPTPIMETRVLSKTLVKRYRWVYGPGHPDNYDLPNVKWNLQVRGPYFIHGAYWHNNFGRRMSHGCINVSYVNAEWIYNWAEVGTPVKTTAS